MEIIRLPAQNVCDISFACRCSNTLYALTGLAAINGQNNQLLNFPISQYEGKMYAIKGLSCRGSCEMEICL